MNDRIMQLLKEELKSLFREVITEVMSEGRSEDFQEDLIDIKQAASLLNLAVNTMYEKTSERTIPFYKRGKKIMFKKSELIEWLEAGRVAVKPDDPQPAQHSGPRREGTKSRRRSARTNSGHLEDYL